MHSVTNIRIYLFTEIHCELYKFIALSDTVKLIKVSYSGIHC